MRRARHPFCIVVTSALVFCGVAGARPAAQPETAGRPDINWLNRSEEDWSVLADRARASGPFDEVKYIPLGSDPKSYLSFGLTLRQRFESRTLRVGGIGPDRQHLSRLQWHADAHLGARAQVFVQVADYRALGARVRTPVDQDRFDLEQAFVAFKLTVASGTLLIRAGRQEIPLDRQRFISNRDGPNVRQPLDAICLIYDAGPWRVAGYYTQPVQTIDRRPFDDRSSSGHTFSGVRVERKRLAGGVFSTYFASLRNDTGPLRDEASETRHVFDVRHAGRRGAWDWDVEGMLQGGRRSDVLVRAWGVGSVLGRTFPEAPASPRIALQLDAASGSKASSVHRVGTFYPLFPNGSYLTLASYPGYANFVHVKPSATARPAASIAVTGALAGLWRLSTSDAVYLLPVTPVPRSAGRGGAYTGHYAQIRAEWRISPHLVSTVEFDRFSHSAGLLAAGPQPGHYLGVDLRFAF